MATKPTKQQVAQAKARAGGNPTNYTSRNVFYNFTRDKSGEITKAIAGKLKPGMTKNRPMNVPTGKVTFEQAREIAKETLGKLPSTLPSARKVSPPENKSSTAKVNNNVSGRSTGGIAGPSGRYVNGVYRPNVTENLVPKTDIAKRIFNAYKNKTPLPQEIKITPPKGEPKVTKSTPKPKPSPSSKMPKGPPTPKEGPKPKPTLKPIRPTAKPTTPNQIKLAQATRERIADAQTLRKAVESGTTYNPKENPINITKSDKKQIEAGALNKSDSKSKRDKLEKKLAEQAKERNMTPRNPRGGRGGGLGGGVGGPFGSRIR